MCWAGVCSQKILPEEMAWGLRLGVRGRSEGGRAARHSSLGGTVRAKRTSRRIGTTCGPLWLKHKRGGMQRGNDERVEPN